MDHRADGVLGRVAAGLAIHAERQLLHRRRAAGAPLDAAAGEDVDGGDLLGDARRMGEAVGHQRDAEAEAEVLGDLRERAVDHFGRRAVRAPLTEVVLDQPHGVEPQPVGETDLLERLPVGLLLARPLSVRVLAGPRPGDVDLVEQVEFHGASECRWSL